MDQNLSVLTASESNLKQRYCRLCLESTDLKFKQLFSPFNTSQSIVEVVRDLAKVSIIDDDSHSKLICSVCLTKLTDSRDFKILIETSDKKLQNLLLLGEDPFDCDDIADNSGAIEDDSDHEKVDIDEIDIKKEIGIVPDLLEEPPHSDLIKSNGHRKINRGRKSRKSESEIGIPQVVLTEKSEDLDLVEDANKIGLKKRGRKVSVKQKVVVKKKRGRPKGFKVTREDESKIKVKRKRIQREYQLKCPDCDMVFKRHIDRKRHLITHTGVYPFYCSFCNKGFASRVQLKFHESTHTGHKNLQCELCGKGFNQRYAFLNHRATHEGEKPFKCDQCFKEFMSNHSLILHMTSKHSTNPEELNFACEICSRQYKTKIHLYNHMRRSHKPCELVTCNICGKAVQHFGEHMKVHTKPFKCTVCNQSFGKSQILQGHMAVHSGERLFECDICKKTFRFRGSLHTHKKTHDLTNRLKCEFCDKQFIYKQQWKLHLEKAHQKFDN